MDPSDALHARYPIGTVAIRTGLSTHVLRAWERRYGLVAPSRDENGVRLYSDADVVHLRLLRRVTEAGHSIGRVASLGTEQLVGMVRAEERASGVAGEAGEPRAAGFVSRAMEAVEAMDATGIHGVLMRAVVALDPMELSEGVIAPLLRDVGERWRRGALCPAHEHLLSVAVRRVLTWLLDTLPTPATAPVLLATTPPGQRHEVGAMLAAVAAADVGWRTVYIGPDLPAAEIVRAARSTGADAVAVSAVYEEERGATRRMLRELRRGLPPEVFLFAGGRALEELAEGTDEPGVAVLADLAGLRIALQATGRGAA